MGLAAILALLDALITTQILGIAYRPFSWQIIARAADISIYDFTKDIPPGRILTKPTEMGEAYQAQSTEILTNPTWVDSSAVVTAQSSSLWITLTNNLSDKQFFRVIKR